MVTSDQDHAVLRSLDFHLGELSTRATKWRTRIKTNKVVTLKGVILGHKNI